MVFRFPDGPEHIGAALLSWLGAVDLIIQENDSNIQKQNEIKAHTGENSLRYSARLINKHHYVWNTMTSKEEWLTKEKLLLSLTAGTDKHDSNQRQQRRSKHDTQSHIQQLLGHLSTCPAERRIHHQCAAPGHHGYSHTTVVTLT